MRSIKWRFNTRITKAGTIMTDFKIRKWYLAWLYFKVAWQTIEVKPVVAKPLIVLWALGMVVREKWGKENEQDSQ
jgi:hypothetical protein